MALLAVISGFALARNVSFSRDGCLLSRRPVRDGRAALAGPCRPAGRSRHPPPAPPPGRSVSAQRGARRSSGFGRRGRSSGRTRRHAVGCECDALDEQRRTARRLVEELRLAAAEQDGLDRLAGTDHGSRTAPSAAGRANCAPDPKRAGPGSGRPGDGPARAAAARRRRGGAARGRASARRSRARARGPPPRRPAPSRAATTRVSGSRPRLCISLGERLAAAEVELEAGVEDERAPAARPLDAASRGPAPRGPGGR